MNIVAFILAIAGAGLSLFQPIISGPFMDLSFSDLLSAPNSGDITTAAYTVLIFAVIAVICGLCALTRKGKGCAFGLILCGVLYLLSASMFAGSSNRNEFTSAMSGMAMSVWMKTVLIWALCYIGAGICAYLDNPEESTAAPESASTSSSSATTGITSKVQSSSPSPQTPQKTFEPVLGVETSALIKRAHLFLSEDDFDEADRYFEQAVRQDPENYAAYLGKLMVKLRLHNAEELCNVVTPLTEYKFFQYALRFANENEKAELQKYLEANANHIEAIKQEEIRKQEEQQKQEEEIKRKALEELTKKYDEAVRLSRSGEENYDSNALHRAARMFDELGDFKDSKILAENAKKATKKQEHFNIANDLKSMFVLFVPIFIFIAIALFIDRIATK